MISPTTYLSFDIYPLKLVEGKYKPLIQNWRGFEPIKTPEVFNSPQEAIAHAKAKIDAYLLKTKGVI